MRSRWFAVLIFLLCLDSRAAGVCADTGAAEGFWSRIVELISAAGHIFTDHWEVVGAAAFVLVLLLQLALMQIYYYRRMINQLKGLMAKMPIQLTLTDVHGKVLFSNIPDSEKDVFRTVKNLSELGDVGDFALKKLAELDKGKEERISFEHEEWGRHYHTTLCRLDNDRLFRTEAFLGVTNNITDRKAGEIRYLNSMKMLNTIMENLPGVLFVKNVDDNFRYVAVNNNFVELLQYPREKAEGRTDYEIFADSPEQAERFRQDDWNTVKGEFLDQIETVSYSGNAHTMRTIKTIVRQEGGPRLLIGMSIDISERAKLAREREEMIENLNQLIAWEQLTNYILLGTISLQGGEFDSVVSRNLSRIGEATGTEHVYIFRYTSPDRSHAELEYGWDRATGKVERNIDDVKLDLTLLSDTGRELAAHGECYYTVEPYPDGKWAAEQETMKRFPNLYARHFAEITVDGKPYGFFGLDYSRGSKYSPERFSTLIRTLAQLYQIDCERELKIRQLHESRDFMRQLIEKIDIPLTLCDEDYNLVMINEKARMNARPEFDSEWKSRKPGEKIKCYHASACGDGKGNPSDFCPVKHCLATGESCSIPHEWQGNHLISSGQFLHDRIHDRRYILVADVDITQRVKNEQQLKEALEAAKAAERAKSAFLATMSHEIRTPLNAIIGFSDILNSAELPPEEQRENIQAILFAGNTLLSLINDILDLSRLEAGQMALVIQKCEFAGLLHSISAIFQMKIRDKKLQYHEVIPENMPVVEVDSLRIKQILLNLIGNAVKFTADGTITAQAEFTPVNGEYGTLKVSVSDTGCGIAPEYRERIFQPFFQQDIVRDSHAYNGTGLGLSISKRLARRMGGELYLKSTGENGSVFVLEIPDVKYYAASGAVETEEVEAESVCTAKNILIVDDVLLNLKVLGSMLRKSGMNTMEASSAAEALALLQKGTEFDLVLTDLWMPEMNGAEFAEAVHRIPSCAKLRVIALTADVEMEQNFPMEHFAGHILKPVTISKLRRVLA